MKEHSVLHETFIIEREFALPPEQVFAAWSDSELKSQWFSKPDRFEFKVGGREKNKGGPPDGPIFHFEAVYQEIVANQRIIYTYTMDQGETRISVSNVTVEFHSSEKGTQLIYTEQGAFIDGYDKPSIREHGTGVMLNNLVEVLAKKNT
ncbi:SRPBCC family protein [Gracilibacillus sp. D59]|uniref:SRPBCC family protein n=1 Tax=Gracilibacillus sp. D59 TaxID=3457434 RepID=UPI003FCDB510